jgi:sugar/nucleoside kinase (ribokinase family)
MSIGRVSCVGIYVVDALGRPIDRAPERGKLVLFDRLELHTGGCANNTAIALARLGVPVSAFGKVGTDAFGDLVLKTLRDNGVDVEFMVRTDEVNTSFTFVVVSSDGERSFYHTIGSNGAFCEEDVPRERLLGSSVVHVAGANLMPRFDGAPTTRLLRWAREQGMMTALDTTWDASGRWLDVIGESLPYVDFFLPSIEEARAMTALEDAEDVAQALLDRGARVVALKMGSEGSYVRTADTRLRLPALRVDVVDTTGAGDAYVGGFLAAQAMGWDIERSAQLATATGAACVTAVGTTPGLRDLDATWALWQNRSLRNRHSDRTSL